MIIQYTEYRQFDIQYKNLRMMQLIDTQMKPKNWHHLVLEDIPNNIDSILYYDADDNYYKNEDKSETIIAVLKNGYYILCRYDLYSTRQWGSKGRETVDVFAYRCMDHLLISIDSYTKAVFNELQLNSTNQ